MVAETACYIARVIFTTLINACFAVLHERFKDDQTMEPGAFRLASDFGGQTVATITYGIPDTCATIMYEGRGETIEDAIAQLSRMVNMDCRVEGEIG